MAAAVAETSQSTPPRKVVPDAVAFALAGVALFALVLDEIDVPHDNLQSVGVLGAGGLVGILVAIATKRSTTAASRERLATLAWDAVRLVLAFEMVRYGMAKIVGMQFYPRYSQLDKRVIELRSGSLAWAFFGHTYGYQAIAGLIEVVSGVLLSLRRTALLGACVMATAMVNVVLVNVFYDLAIKLMSSVYLGLDLCLIVRDAPRLRALFLLSQVASESRRSRIVAASAIALALVLPTAEILHQASAFGVFHRDLLEGAWSVDDCQGIGVTGQDVWSRIYFEKAGRDADGNIRPNVGFVHASDGNHPFEAQVSERARKLRLFLHGADAPPLEGDFDLQGSQLHVQGNSDGRPFRIDLTRDFPK